ncbi:hypothetical protein D3C81_2116530 [compost metagenome]
MVGVKCKFGAHLGQTAGSIVLFDISEQINYNSILPAHVARLNASVTMAVPNQVSKKDEQVRINHVAGTKVPVKVFKHDVHHNLSNV